MQVPEQLMQRTAAQSVPLAFQEQMPANEREDTPQEETRVLQPQSITAQGSSPSQPMPAAVQQTLDQARQLDLQMQMPSLQSQQTLIQAQQPTPQVQVLAPQWQQPTTSLRQQPLVQLQQAAAYDAQPVRVELQPPPLVRLQPQAAQFLQPTRQGQPIMMVVPQTIAGPEELLSQSMPGQMQFIEQPSLEGALQNAAQGWPQGRQAVEYLPQSMPQVQFVQQSMPQLMVERLSPWMQQGALQAVPRFPQQGYWQGVPFNAPQGLPMQQAFLQTMPQMMGPISVMQQGVELVQEGIAGMPGGRQPGVWPSRALPASLMALSLG